MNLVNGLLFILFWLIFVTPGVVIIDSKTSSKRKRKRMWRMVDCDECGEVYSTNNIGRHKAEVHGSKICTTCDHLCKNTKDLKNHKKLCRVKIARSRDTSINDFQYQPTRRAIQNRFQTFSIEPNTVIDHEAAINESLVPTKRILEQTLQQLSAVKFYLYYEINLKKHIEDEETHKTFGFHSKTRVLLQSTNIDETLQLCKVKISDSIDAFMRKGSGWIFDGINDIELYVTEYRPIGGCYIPLPPALKKKRCLLNIKNSDNHCLKWALLGSFYRKSGRDDHSNRVSNYIEHSDKLNFDGVSWPCTISEIPKIEKLNNIRINVYGYDCDLKTGVYPVYISPRNDSRVASLLLVDNGYNQHYVVIKSLDALVRGKTKYGKM